MLPPLFDIEPLIDAIQNDSLILTANQRLKSKAIDAWGIHLQSEQQTCWKQPKIYSLSHWIDSLWFTLQGKNLIEPLSSIVSADQERILWQRVTKNCGKMQGDKIAKQASTAFKNIQRWKLSLSTLKHQSYFINDQHQTFIQWCQDYQALLKKNNLISEEDKIKQIIDAFKQGILVAESQAYIIGFDDISPLIDDLFNIAITNEKITIRNTHIPRAIGRKNFDHPTIEITAAAQWAYSLLKNHLHEQCRIGIIVPELSQHRNEIVQVFTKIFEPQQNDLNSQQRALPFNISAGTPLGTTPFIADSLRLLKILSHRHQIDDCLQWIYSPFWGKQSIDQDQRLQLAQAIKRLELFEITASQLRFHAQKIENTLDKKTHPSLFDYLYRVKKTQDTWNPHALPSLWVEQFLTILDILDWPGERPSDSLEYQQTQQWYQVLEIFAGLDSVLGLLNINDAIKELSVLLNQTPFQAKVPDAPIQILGILEGVGLRFSHCWVMGLNQHCWPPAPSPNPLIPFNFQKKLNMPNATALRELNYAQSLTQNYCHCADEIVMSHADHDRSGDIHWQPSQLINNLPRSDCDYFNNGSVKKLPYKKLLLEKIICNSGPPIKRVSQQTAILRGGTNIIKMMVENPFDAFSRFRLDAQTIDEPVSGFTEKAKGNILHKALATIWQKLRSQKTLLETPTQELKLLVTNSISEAVNLERQYKHYHLQKNICQLEIDRQCKLILNWLEIEKDRPSFIVEHIEKSIELTTNGIKIPMRIDRIDRLADGSLIIIDYKTSVTALSAWQAEQPSDPQLPFYLLAFSDLTSAIAFAQINAKAITLKGLHNGMQKIPTCKGFMAIGDNKLQLPRSWDAAKTHWRITIEKYLTRYCEGDTTILLKNTHRFNQDLLALNRFDEKDLLTNIEIS